MIDKAIEKITKAEDNRRMETMIKILIVAVVLLIAITLWSMCIAASRSDEEAERIYQEYLEYKRKREEEE